MDIKTKAYIFILFSLVGGALFPIALKVAAQSNVSIYSFMFMAFLISTPTSLLLVALRGKLSRLKAYAKNPKEYLMLGLIGFTNLAFVDYGIIYSEHFVSASLATVIYRMQPLLMLLFIPLVLRERVTKIQMAALMLAFAGIYIALGAGGLSVSWGTDTGIVLFLVAMTLISAFSTVFLKRYTTDMESTMFIFNSVALVIALGLFLLNGGQLPMLNTSSTIALLYMGVIMSVCVPFFYYSAFRVLKTTFVTNLYFLSPFLTILFAGMLLNEPIYTYYIIVAVLVAVGLIIQKFDKEGGTYVAKSKSVTGSPATTIYDVTSAFTDTNVEAIHNTIKGSGRVLAIKLNHAHMHHIRSVKPHESGVVYTDSDKNYVSQSQASFLKEIMGKAEGEIVLMFAGNPSHAEAYLKEIGSKATEQGANTEGL
jgi:drug/metabolite transporter (DMT)-like permease